jgi:hypothetical protein
LAVIAVVGFVLAACVAVGLALRSTSSKTVPSSTRSVLKYKNPVIGSDFPDPDIVYTGNHYVAVSTGSNGMNVPTAVSTDLSKWKLVGDALPVLPPWSVASWRYVWAPDLVKVGTHWDLWFTARDVATGRQCIGWMTSDSARGPFHGGSQVPTVCQSQLGGSIDPSVFVDSRGDRWLLWKNDGNCCGLESRIWSQRLGADGTTVVGAATPILSYSGGWESSGVSTSSTIENPSMVQVGNTLHLFFSGNGYDGSNYAVGHAICTTPVGPCGLPSEVPILSSYGSVVGTGGEAIFRDNHGALWMAYAAWTSPRVGYEAGGVRSMRIDRLLFFGDVPIVAGPTTSPVTLSRGLSTVP